MAARFHRPPLTRPRRPRPATPPAVQPVVHVMPRPGLRLVRLVVVDCPACGLHAGPFLPAEAGQLAGSHDDLQHRGHPTATVCADPDPRPVHAPAAPPPFAGPDLDGAA